jgi:hypothetical protein
LPRKIAKNPVSSSSDSQPNEYQVWPTLTIDWYSAHSTSHISMPAHSGTMSATPAKIAALVTAPMQQTAAKSRSE